MVKKSGLAVEVGLGVSTIKECTVKMTGTTVLFSLSFTVQLYNEFCIHSYNQSYIQYRIT